MIQNVSCISVGNHLLDSVIQYLLPVGLSRSLCFLVSVKYFKPEEGLDK